MRGCGKEKNKDNPETQRALRLGREERRRDLDATDAWDQFEISAMRYTP